MFKYHLFPFFCAPVIKHCPPLGPPSKMCLEPPLYRSDIVMDLFSETVAQFGVRRLWGDVWRGVTKKTQGPSSVVRSAEFIIDRKLPARTPTTHDASGKLARF